MAPCLRILSPCPARLLSRLSLHSNPAHCTLSLSKSCTRSHSAHFTFSLCPNLAHYHTQHPSIGPRRIALDLIPRLPRPLALIRSTTSTKYEKLNILRGSVNRVTNITTPTCCHKDTADKANKHLEQSSKLFAIEGALLVSIVLNKFLSDKILVLLRQQPQIKICYY